jgi:hypothetical protein
MKGTLSSFSDDIRRTMNYIEILTWHSSFRLLTRESRHWMKPESADNFSILRMENYL